MEWLQSPDYWTARLVLQRATAGVYLIAFLVAVNQFRPLLGERGLLPTPRFLELVSFRRAPSIFHLHYSDRFFGLVAWTGVLLAASALLGLPESSALWVSMLVWFALWAIYLSIVNIGQVFYGFGWESLLLETGFLAIFLGPADMAPPTLVLWAVRSFGSVTKERLEVVIEGTAATTPAPGTDWREYEFKAKPGDPRRCPPQVAPYHLRLDWLMWFAALPRRSDDRWLKALLHKLLENDRPTLKLMRRNPFPDEPPAFVRTTLYHYRFSSRRERRETGAWWVRRRVRMHIPPMRAVTSWRDSGKSSAGV